MTLVSTLHHICARRTRWANLHAGDFPFFTLYSDQELESEGLEMHGCE